MLSSVLFSIFFAVAQPAPVRTLGLYVDDHRGRPIASFPGMIHWDDAQQEGGELGSFAYGRAAYTVTLAPGLMLEVSAFRPETKGGHVMMFQVRKARLPSLPVAIEFEDELSGRQLHLTLTDTWPEGREWD